MSVKQRQIIDEPPIDHLPGFGIFGLDCLRLRPHLDSLRGARHFQRQIGGRILVHVDLEFGAFCLTKTLSFDGHNVHPGRDRAEQIPSATVGGRLEIKSFFLVGEDDLRPCNHGARCVGQLATDCSEVSLAKHRRNNGEYDDEEDEK